jgi:hypothetical protein
MRSLLILSFALIPYAAIARVNIEENFICPIGGERFKAVIAASGTSFGQYLDLKPYGPVAAPWPLAKCPTNGFVMYKSKFSDVELARLKELVVSPAYQDIKALHTPYYLSAVLQRHINAPLKDIASTLLKATWEVEDHRYAAYATEALAAHVALLKTEPVDGKNWITYQLIAGELERRLERFEDANNRFSAIKDSVNIQPLVKRMVDFQLTLIAARNATPQMVPSEEK